MRLLMLIFCLLNLSLQLNASETNFQKAQEVEIVYEKINLNPSQVFFCENEIFVLFENGLTKVDVLKTDFGNLYTEKAYWLCPRCRNKNELGFLDCAYCPYTLPYKIK